MITHTPLSRSPKRIHLSTPEICGREMQHIQEAFDTNWLSTVGPNIDLLEKDFSQWLGCPAIAVASGTAAIHLGLRLFGIKAGDEVIAPTLTFVATCNPILYQQATPIFIDSERMSWNLNPELLETFLRKRAALNRLPKLVIVVHLFGQSANLAPIQSACERYEIPLLEDAAESLGSSYQNRFVGTFGKVGIFSFNGNKIITGSGGGMLVSEAPGWVEKARFWSMQACEPGFNYLHSELGYNYRYSNVLAGMARAQLAVLGQRIRQRRAVAFRYRDAWSDIPGIELMPQAPYGLHTNWLSCFLIEKERFGLNAAELISSLNAANVEARPVWKPMHTQKLYQEYECIGGAVAEDLNQRGICLPSSSNLSSEDQQFVIDRIREAHFSAKKGRH